ncbi:helix-turn-helix domain-containing GNAT family N-acetyltransferase [Sphingobium aquiterrae]|uniref:bifunctional helix-turn-helix transcriptional regulator/GNAT family N-acetyltransferase n=1 Tax=Sphingobium aquiterrae TaxID=2038656 RepID=UPI00301699BE
MTDAVLALRAFNRFHTRFVGALQPRYMGSDMGLTAARLLYEIAQGDGVLASALQERLGLDSGYVSRMLRDFEKRGWIMRGRGEDARQRPIGLTDAGRAAFAALDARTRADVEDALAPLGADQRKCLIEALATIRSLLGDPPRTWSIRPFAPGDLGMLAARQSRIYAEGHGWGRPLEQLEYQVVADFLRDFTPAREQCWIAQGEGRMLGSVLLTEDRGADAHAHADTARLRLLYVEADARGLGIGRALVAQCIAFARATGYARVLLWTHSVLESARRIYAGAGFVRISVDVHDHFGAPVEGETWSLDLAGVPAAPALAV